MSERQIILAIVGVLVVLVAYGLAAAISGLWLVGVIAALIAGLIFLRAT